jgi:hypothetical protein
MSQITERIDSLLEAARPNLSRREMDVVGELLLAIEDEKFRGDTDRFYRWISKSTDDFREELWADLETRRGADRKKLSGLPVDVYVWIHAEHMLG